MHFFHNFGIIIEMGEYMKILGLIMECNPFHNGHKYFIDKAINQVKPDATIAVVSTSFTMRGEISIVDKFEKTKHLLNNAVDLVTELPVALGVNSADYFAYNCINILNTFGITDLAFGIEESAINIIEDVFAIIQTKEFNTILLKYLKYPYSYKVAFSEALKELNLPNDGIEAINQPNATLALQYLYAIKKINNKLHYHFIKRIANNYNDTTSLDNTFASARTIREMAIKRISVAPFLPYHIDNDYFVDLEKAKNSLLTYLKYQVLINKPDYKKIKGCDEGIENYLVNNLQEPTSYNALVDQLKNKKYTSTRFQRLFIYLLLNIPRNNTSEYLRILGFNKQGEKILNGLPKSVKNNLITSLKNNNSNTALIELRASRLYDLLTNKRTYEQEFKVPIKK